ncbi:MAG: hypothetical protein ACE5LU_23220 [Anaerolineae bacterium]
MDQQKTQDPAQLLIWLDEQHREDRRQLADLSKLAEAQYRELEDLTKRFEDLERRLAGTQTQLVKFAEIEAALQELKNEIMGVLEESQAGLQKTDTRLESQLEAQEPKLANLAKALQAVQSALSTLESQVETMPARIDSQMEQMAGLARDIEEFEKRFNQTQARLAQLNERLSNQVDSTAALARQVENLGGRLSNTRAKLVKFSQIEAAIQETRDELVFMVKDLEEERKKEARESAQLRESELKGIQVALDSIQKRLEPIPQLDERVKALAAEDKRLRDLISQHEQRIPPLQKSIENHRERISYLEEDRPRTSRRIDELESKIPLLDEAIEENAARFPFLYEWAQRSAEQIDELKRFEDQMERWRAAFVEEIRRGEQLRDRRLGDWEKVLDEHAEIIDQWQDTLRRYEIAHQDNRRFIGDLQMLAQRLERDQAEVAEQQRLADERLQRELEAWQDENEKRWRLFLKERDYDWAQQDKRDTEQDRRVKPLEVWRDEHSSRFAEQLDRLDENDRRILARLVDLVRYLDKALEHQIKQRKAQRDLLSEEKPLSDLLATRSPAERRPRGAQRATRSEGQ